MSVHREREDGSSLVELDRPEAMNSFDQPTIEALRDAIRAAMASDQTDVLVLRATGKAFCTGADLRLFQEAIEEGNAREVVRELSSTMNEAILAIVEGDKPVVAEVDGVAAGGGLGLLLCCDLRIASPRARFTPAFLSVGVSPDGGATWFLPRMVGDARARDLILRNDVIDAEQAHEWGLITEVADTEGLGKRTKDVARSLAAGPAKATAWAKQRLARADELREHLAYETEATAASAATADFEEGVKAFLEGREPRFR